jgi:hypothetical protein
MTSTVRESIVPLKHADTEWAVRQRIELAPGDMAIRELLRNAIENALLLPSAEERWIVIKGIQWRASLEDDPVRKLAIWNRGPGMNEEKLLSILDLAASGDEKRQGADANYGVGAKTAGLKASPEGLRYRSCCGGRVHEAIIGYRKGVFGKIKRQIGNQWCEVWDATDACLREGYPLHYDWTEVLLMGLAREHDTVDNLFLENTEDQVWLSQAITRRFYDLSDVDVQRDESATPTTDHGRRLLGLKAIGAKQDQVVTTSLGKHRIGIRYGVMKERTGGGTNTRLGYTAHACVVFANECFDFHESLPWRRVAPRFGIAHGQGQVFVHVLLPDKYPAVFDQYRKNIEDPDRTRLIRLEDFQELVFDNRPQWLIDFIASQAPAQLEMSDGLKRRLKELTDYLKWYRELYKFDVDGALSAVPADDNGSSLPTPPGPDPVPSPDALGEKNDDGLRPASEHLRRRGTIPDHVWVKGGTAQHRGELSQRCARYDRQLHRLFLNDQFEGIERSVEMVVADFQHVLDQGVLRTDATKFVKEEVTYRAIEHVMLGLVHESLEHWSRADVKGALACEAISVPLSDYRSIAASVVPRLRPTYGKV